MCVRSQFSLYDSCIFGYIFGGNWKIKLLQKNLVNLNDGIGTVSSYYMIGTHCVLSVDSMFPYLFFRIASGRYSTNDVLSYLHAIKLVYLLSNKYKADYF